jgi:NADH-quinone oxidoreductase subunit C
MSSVIDSRIEAAADRIEAQLGERVQRIASICGELTYEVAAANLLQVCKQLRDNEQLKFEQLVDLTGVDYMSYGQVEWSTQEATSTGFSRGRGMTDDEVAVPIKRYAVVYHLMSIANNVRVRLRAFCDDNELPILDSVVSVWASANWFEREVFDLFGVLFNDHPDLRRILTDYGFIGHPFRKDFPLIGNVEVRYDEAKGRVVYQPVSIEPRTLVPRVIRDDNRYNAALK